MGEISEKRAIEDVEYVEIADEDLDNVSFIFGSHQPGYNQTVLVPVHPSSYAIPLTNQFKIQIYEKKENATLSFLLYLKHI
ncbi:MAG: hypothetical protein PHS30_03580 [Bacteroidales bacterium]|nr:hypothetical protein [Bacteroidales bacterium]